MDEEVLLKVSTPVSKKYLLIYIFSSILLIAFTIVAISLHDWFTYCYWNFGLVRASTFLHNSPFKNEDTISDVRADACYGLKDTTENECGKFCDFPTRFELGGAFILLFTIISVVSQTFTLFYHFLRYKRKDFKLGAIGFLICFTFALQFVGFIGYYFIAGFILIKNVSGHKRIGDSLPKDFEWRAGMVIYLILFVLQLGLMIFGLIFTKRGFK